MPNTSSAKKALRVSKRKNAINTRNTKEYKGAIKAVKDAVQKNSLKDISELLKKAQSSIDTNVKKGTLVKNTGSRIKSRLVKLVKKAA